MNTNDIASFYDKQCLQFKENWKAAHWSSRESQEDNFNLMSHIAPFEPTDRILDLGCGAGDFYGFMQKRGWKATYEGVDVSQNMIDRAWTKYPKGRFAKIDFMSETFNFKYDWIIAAGTFNHKVENQYEYVFGAMKKMHSLARKGCGVIFMSKHDPAQAAIPTEYLFGYDPVEVLKLCMELTPWVNFNHTALSWGFVVFFYNGKWMMGS